MAIEIKNKRISISADASQISDFMKCPRLWYYKYIKSIEPTEKRIDEDLSMNKGTLVHALLDYYYKANPTDLMRSANECLTKFSRETPKLDVSPKDQQLIMQRFLQYVGNYSKFGEFQPLRINGVPQVEVGFSNTILDTDQYHFVLEGRIDLITDKEVFVDHKTQSKKYNYYHYNPQFLTYSLATGLSSGCINYISLAAKTDEETFRRYPFIVTVEMRDRWKEKVIKIFKRMAGCVVNNEFEMNENSCQGNFGICKYTQLCETIDPNIQKRLINFKFKEREKWEPWRLSENGS